ncbi:MAG: MFS transporter [Chloroflexi bacterium]|nr:MFS transporter [Chloroflexota bacterium]
MRLSLPAKPKLFYGWWMILACDLILTVSGGVWFYGFGAFLKPIADEFGWSRAATSVGFSLARLESAGVGIPAGYLSDRFGPRKVMLIGIAVTGIGLMLFTQVNNLGSFYAVCIVVALGYGFGFFVPMATAVANWFDRKIGKAMGLFQAGFAGCGLIPPILVLLINIYGWRQTLVIAGIAVVVICIPLSFLVRHRPEPYGYLPDGAQPQQALHRSDVRSAQQKEPSTSLSSSEAREFTVREALRQPSFWLLTAAFSLSSFTYSAVLVHGIPYLIEIGFSAEVAALGMASVTISSFLGRIGFGWMGDRFRMRYLMAICFALQSIGVFVFARAEAFWLLLLSLSVFGPGYGGSMPLRVAMQRDYFGRKTFGTTQGTMLAFISIPTALGPIFAGWIFDVMQSYRLAFLLSALIYIVAIGLIVLAKPPAKARA